MSHRFVVLERPVQGSEGSLLTLHATRRGAGGTVRRRRLLVGGPGQRLGGQLGRDALTDRMSATFDLGEGHPLGGRDGMVVRAMQGGEHLAGGLLQVVRDFGVGHG